jgi:N-acetylmuramoyl-L-alanine amidase
MVASGAHMRVAERVLTGLVLVAMAGIAEAAMPARTMYSTALAREHTARTMLDEPAASPEAVLKDIRSVIAAYEALVRRHPASGYCDNALWQAGELAGDAFGRFAEERDRQAAVRLLRTLVAQYPTSSLVAKARAEVKRLQQAPAPKPASARPSATREPERQKPAAAPARATATPDRQVPSRTASGPPQAEARQGPEGASPPGAAAEPPPANNGPHGRPEPVTIREIRRTVLQEVVRVSVELDAEVPYHQERVENPARLLFDFRGTRPAPALADVAFAYQDDVVRHIRVGRHPNQVTRVVVDLDGVASYTVFPIYNPYRLVIDCVRDQTRSAPVVAGVPPPLRSRPLPPLAAPPALPAVDTRASTVRQASNDTTPPETASPPATTLPPAPVSAGPSPTQSPTPPGSGSPASHPQGGFSIARQLGLGISRIVIDAGHGGHDPGAEGASVAEATVVLDVALRLEKLLLKQPGVEVVLTRRTDVFVPLEERTAIANREQADLFLSIHANASRDKKARGIETYFLNFATTPDAEVVAARENAASERTMNSLADIVKAITLNNKLDESRTFASLVDKALVRRLRTTNKRLKDHGVKQAPFVVLIGASMPSVLVEISFITNKQEGQLLRSAAYRQRVAEALAEGIRQYQQSLKPQPVVAHR